MDRMKWTRDGYSFASACGRFIIRPVCLNPKWGGYRGLIDTKTGREYPCRTEASAKTAARNILIFEAAHDRHAFDSGGAPRPADAAGHTDESDIRPDRGVGGGAVAVEPDRQAG